MPERAAWAAAEVARRYVVEMRNPSPKLVATEFLAEEMIAAYLDSLLSELPEEAVEAAARVLGPEFWSGRVADPAVSRALVAALQALRAATERET